MEDIKDILNCTQDGDDVESETLKSELIDALADVRLSHPTEIYFLISLTLFPPPKDLGVDNWEVSRSIMSSFERHSGGPQGEVQKATKEEEG